MKVEHSKPWAVGLLGLLLGLFLAAPASAQEPRGGALEKWQRLTPERQQELKRRFEDFRALDPDARRVLIERAQELREDLDRIPAGADASQRERLMRLAPEQRRAALGDFMRASARFLLPGPKDSLPPELRGDFERLGPAHGPLLFERARDQLRARIGEQALERFGTKLGMSKERIEALAKLPADERAKAVLEHLRNWPALDLPPKVRQFLELRLPPPGPPGPPQPMDLPGGQAGRPGTEHPGPGGGAPPGPRAGPRRPPIDFSGPAGVRPDRPAPIKSAIARKLLEAIEPQLEDFLLAAEAGQRLLPPDLERLQRERLLAAFPGLTGLSPALRREFERAPLPLLIERARGGLDRARRPGSWMLDRPPKPPR